MPKDSETRHGRRAPAMDGRPSCAKAGLPATPLLRHGAGGMAHTTGNKRSLSQDGEDRSSGDELASE